MLSSSASIMLEKRCVATREPYENNGETTTNPGNMNRDFPSSGFW